MSTRRGCARLRLSEPPILLRALSLLTLPVLLSACGAEETAAAAEDAATSPHQDAGPSEDDALAEKPDAFAGKPDAFAEKPDAFAGKPDAFTEKPDAGAALLTARLDPGLPRSVPGLPGPDGVDCPTSVVTIDGQGPTFVENEAVLVDTPEAVDAFAAAVGGQVLVRHALPQEATQREVALVHFTPPAASPDEAAGAIRTLRPETKGELALGSEAGAATLTAIARAQSAGTPVGLNLVLLPAGVAERRTSEHPMGPNRPATSGGAPAWTYSPDAYQWPYVGPTRPAAGSPWVGSGVGEAWRLATLAGLYDDGTQVDVAILDAGFALASGVLSAGRVEWNAVPWSALGRPNPMGCGGNPCPWHGTEVAQTVGAAFDDASGGVGSAGTLARMSYYQILYDGFGTVAALAQAARDGQRVANLSFQSVVLPIGLNWTLLPFDAAVAVSAIDMIVVAAAGNDGTDVATGVANEEIDVLTYWPCESQAVFCVGAANWNGRRRTYSNWSVSPMGVDLFAPDDQLNWDATPNGRGPGNLMFVGGTSLASPWVAGILAIARAAAPDWSAAQVSAVAIQTAVPGVEPTVNRSIDAEALVRRALAEGDRRFDPTAATPTVRFIAPAEGEAPYGDVRFEVEVDQPNGHAGLGCCRLEWTSTEPTDPPFPAGTVFTQRLLPGMRTVGVVAVNDFGLRSAPALRPLDLRNLPPEIDAVLSGVPIPGETLFVTTQARDANGDRFSCRDLRYAFEPGWLEGWSGRPVDLDVGVCELGMSLPVDFSGPVTITVFATDELGAEASVTVGADVAANPVPMVSIVRPGVLDVPFSTLGPDLALSANPSVFGVTRWYASGLDDDLNALTGLQFLRDGNGPAGLPSFTAWLDQGLCVRPQGQAVRLQVDLLDGGGETLASDSRVVHVVCPPG